MLINDYIDTAVHIQQWIHILTHVAEMYKSHTYHFCIASLYRHHSRGFPGVQHTTRRGPAVNNSNISIHTWLCVSVCTRTITHILVCFWKHSFAQCVCKIGICVYTMCMPFLSTPFFTLAFKNPHANKLVHVTFR